MHLRRVMLANTWIQLLLVGVIVVLGNTWAAGSFTRLDLTEDRLYSLDLTTRALMYRIERPMTAKVYFTGGLQAPYNNHEQIVVDKLEDLRAYSKGLLDIQVVDPTNVADLEEEAKRFGIQPIQYRYRSANVSELKKVYMGLALVYGDKQEVLPAITQVETLEYDLARSIKALVSDEERKVIGFSTGHGEPDFLNPPAKSPLEVLRNRLAENYDLASVPLGGIESVPDEVDALFLVGPQRPLSERAQYQVDQFLMRGGALTVLVTNTKPDMRSLRPQSVYHGLEPLLAHYGVTVNRDVVVDRTQNGQMRFPVRQGNYVVQTAVNYPLIPRASDLNQDSVIVRDLDTMLFPFVSSLDLVDPLPPDLTATVLANSSSASGRIKGIRTIDPTAYRVVAPTEQMGQWPLLVALTGEWSSYFAAKDIPAYTGEGAASAPPDDPAGKLRASAPTRMVVGGSADFIANNIPFVLNLADWMVQDEALIGIRSKVVNLPTLDQAEPERIAMLKAINLLSGSALLLAVGGVRWAVRRKTGGYRESDEPDAGVAA